MIVLPFRKLFPRFVNVSVFCENLKFSKCNTNTHRKLVTSTGIKPVKMVFVSFKNDNQMVNKFPIIVMHGLLGSKMNWGSLGKAMAKETGKEVYLVDARNHGDSPHSDHHTYFHLSEDVKLFMSEHNIEKAALIGHSMGGRAMMAFALQHPDKVESLTVVDISPVATPKSMDSMLVIFDTLSSVKPFISETLSSARKVVEKILFKALDSKALSQFLSQNLGEKEKGTFGWKINLEQLIKHYSHITQFPIKSGQFNGPVLFISGGDSDFVNLNDADKIKNFFPKVSFKVIDSAGHWVHADQPKKFLEHACHFIKSASV